jgi:hypothetical protein
VLPDTLKRIVVGAFKDCDSLRYIMIPSSVTTIENGAFTATFLDADGNELAKTAEALRGHSYRGSEGVLRLFDGAAVGDTISVDGLIYSVVSENPYVLSLTGYEVSPKALVVPSIIYYGNDEMAVASIGNQAFYGCTTMTSANLGSVSEVGVKAFANCTNLKKVDVGESLKTMSAYAFYRCVRMTEIGIEDSAKTLRAIGSYALYKCDKLASIAVPSFVTTIGDDKPFPADMADENGNVLDITPGDLAGYIYKKSDGKYLRQAVPKVGSSIPGGKLTYCITATLPAEAEVIGHSDTFRNITIPETVDWEGQTYRVTAIGEGAFKNYVKIRTVSMPNIEKIGKEAFYGCTYVKPTGMDSVKSIGVKAFARCSSMGDVTFGDSLKTIGAYAFYGCKSLTEIDVPDSVTSIGSYAFYKCSGLEDVYIGDSLKKIGSCAFAYCAGLEYINFPESLSSVGSKAFKSTTFLDGDGAEMPKTAKSLSGKAFAGSDSTLRVSPDGKLYAVRVVTAGSEGSVSVSYFRVPQGTVLRTSGDTLVVEGYGTSVATPAPSDAQHAYSFICWTEGDAVVTGDWVVTAHFMPH